MPAPGDCRYRSVGAAPHVSALGIIQSPPVCLAISCRAIEEFQRLVLTKESAFGARLSEQPQAHVCLAQAEALVRSARTDWHENGEAVWEYGSPRQYPFARGANGRTAGVANGGEELLAAADLM